MGKDKTSDIQHCGTKPKTFAFGIAPLGIISIGIVPMGVVSIGVVPMGVSPVTINESAPSSIAFAGPDEFKYDTSIDIFTAYKYYIKSKPWVSSNYLRDPSRKPSWV